MYRMIGGLGAVLVGMMILAGSAHAGFDWGQADSNCSGHGTMENFVAHYATTPIGDIPAGKQDVFIKLTSDQDLDIRLSDKTTGTKIVHWPDGILSGHDCQSIQYQGMNIEWSGHAGDATHYGHEYIRITGEVTRPLTMNAFGYRPGYATVTYSWGGDETCTDAVSSEGESGSGSFEQRIPYDDTVEVGRLAPGLNNVYIELDCEEDVDIQLYDGDMPIIGWPDGILSGHNYQSTQYQGMNIEWSGHAGDTTNYGHEYIRITGKINRTLTVKAFGYRSGYATVNYSWESAGLSR